jgi:serine/threonine protein kinase
VNEVVGEGGFGVVRRVTCRTTGADKAVKTCDAGAAVQLEVDLLRRIGPHPHTMNIEAVYIENSNSNSCNHSNYIADDATDRRQVHIVSDLYGGGDLFDHIGKALRLHGTPLRPHPHPFACCIH